MTHPNGHVQIIKNSPEKSNLDLSKTNLTRPKRFVPIQNNFGPIVGQGKGFKKLPEK